MDNKAMKKKFDELKEVVNSNYDEITDESFTDFDMPMATDELKEEHLNKNLTGEYGLTDNEAVSVIQMIQKINNGETIDNPLDKLPFRLKSIILKLCAANGIKDKKLANEFAIDLLNNIRSDANVSAEIDNFNEVLAKEMQIGNLPSITSMYNSSMKEYMEKTLLEQIEAEKDKNPEVYERVHKLSATYTESYKFQRIIDAIKKNKKCRVKDLDWRLDAKKYCLNFNRLISYNTPLQLHPIYEIVEVGIPCIPELKEDDLKKILVAICKFADKAINIKDIFDQSYIYYTITNLYNMTMTAEGVELSDLEEEIKTNLYKLLEVINNYLK